MIIRRAIWAAAAVTPWIYLGWLRPWQLRWGATAEEARRDLPGDELLPHPMLEATRAVTIKAPPERVWPWIVQMGTGRGGFYAIDLIDNGAHRSADRILPEWQHLAVGDVMPTNPDGTGFAIREVDPPRLIVLHVPEAVVGRARGAVSVAMVLDGRPDGSTRLVCRLRGDYGPNVASRLYGLMFEPGDFVMTRLMLAGIKARAERAAATVSL